MTDKPLTFRGNNQVCDRFNRSDGGEIETEKERSTEREREREKERERVREKHTQP